MQDVYELIEKEDLTPDLKLIADVCGIIATQKLLKHLNGMSFYIPRLSRLKKFILRYAEINNNKTTKEIAKELRVTEKYIIDLLLENNGDDLKIKRIYK